VSELRALVAAARRQRQAGGDFLLATVVHAEGSSYRRAGARILIDETGACAGSVSGGCLEADLVRRGWWRAGSRGPVVIRYDSRSDEDPGWGVGLGCRGVVDLLLERFSGGGAALARQPSDVSPGTSRLDPLGFLEDCLVRERRGALVTVYRSSVPGLPVGTRLTRHVGEAGAGDDDADDAERSDVEDPAARAVLSAAARAAIATGRTGRLEHRFGAPQPFGAAATETAIATATATAMATASGVVEALVEAIVPPPHLWIFGAGPDAVPLLLAARAVGWTVTVCDAPSRWQTRERFAAAHHLALGPLAPAIAACGACATGCAVLMSHQYERDREVLAALLATNPPRYIGVLGPRERTDRLLGDLEGRGALREGMDLTCLYAPIGLAIGAETPAEIALSVVAEIQAVWAGADAGFLRDRGGAIHAPAAASRPELGGTNRVTPVSRRDQEAAE
jgi:xanthine/CO dehydrogenase XdhC/CoxF family maturation factor